MTLGARQRKQTIRELERAARQKDRQKLEALRDEIRTARELKRRRLKEVTSSCRTARRTIAQRASAARRRLEASIKRTREKARTLCSAARGSARTQTLEQIEHALRALERERAEQNTLRIWTTRDKRTGLPRVTRVKAERQSESDDEVRANIDDPGLRVVFEAVKERIKAGKHRSRTEAFFEWAAEHTGEVYRLQEADAEQRLRELEREERTLAKALRSTRGRRPLAQAVPF